MAIERIIPRRVTLDSMIWDGTPETLAALQEWTRRPDGSPGFLPRTELEKWGGVSALLWVEFMKCWQPIGLGHRAVKDPFQRGFFPLEPQDFELAYEIDRGESDGGPSPQD